MSKEDLPKKPYWFVGCHFGKQGDQYQRFIDQGIWENGYTDKHLTKVKSMRVGDKIAIKAAYTQKKSLPFDSHGHSVSVMEIKATGVITENYNDGRTVKVDWIPSERRREWYFYTYRQVIWKVTPGKWMADDLIRFTFHNQAQDLSKFQNDPYWKERFGDNEDDLNRFEWTQFYENVASELLKYRSDRVPLVQAIHDISQKTGVMSVMQDKHADGSVVELSDICPFTVFALFNRGITDKNRKIIAKALADFLGVTQAVPQSYNGIPVVNNQSSWFFSYANTRGAEDIDLLWSVFEKAIQFADIEESDVEIESQFLQAYQEASGVKRAAWNLTMGFYWIRPWQFVTLDTQSRNFIEGQLGIDIPKKSPKKICKPKDYLSLRNNLLERFAEESYPVHSFPDLSFSAFKYEASDQDAITSVKKIDVLVKEDLVNEDPMEVQQVYDSYSVDSIIEDGCFLDPGSINGILKRLKTKKNIILQGPPGTGKTWLAKRLAFALLGEKAINRVKAVQFHPNLSYEDFVRGYRPSEGGKLELSDGPFLEVITQAIKNPESSYVLVIEEINRGNPAQIFGEMLTLLEESKRTSEEALELCYRRNANERVYIPGNLFVVGTMNIADRSLALVDFALRRRFAFIDLKPELGQSWIDWVHQERSLSLTFLSNIQDRVKRLNLEISGDRSLGHQFQIGHSYFVPNHVVEDELDWFIQIVETEVGPLLEEYWFDDLNKAQEAKQQLTSGL